ncbi:MAG TPA: FAD-dependent oxidoreductase [Nitrososphaeraceae archaeon]|nr:FAD-dependent oxidoreductase [Nitrososphaeraceae archaeon]
MNERKHYHIVIIGGGILGCSIAYLLSYNLGSDSRILLIEQESSPGFHASSRNTGKVHAPFLYDPTRRKLFAKSASLGFEMIFEYCRTRHLTFIRDGILEVATKESEIAHLHRYLEWGYSNGLHQDELYYLDKRDVAALEPNVRCKGAIHCTKDASVNYGEITSSLLNDARHLGCKVMFSTKVVSVKSGEHSSSDQSSRKYCQDSTHKQRHQGIRLTLSAGSGSIPNPGAETYVRHSTSDNQRFVTELSTDYLVNVAGGGALHIAHGMGLATGYAVLHFKGEYWLAPPSLRDLTKRSIYSVPKYHEYPFLDPHWIVRVDGRREVGPNALLVSGPFAYDWHRNMRLLLPNILQSIKCSGRLGLIRLFRDKRFLSLLLYEFRSSLSKRAMINRAKRFLPALDPSLFTVRGTSGIRSSLVDMSGRFVPDILFVGNEDSVHTLNYNSPGATGALPVAALIVDRIMKLGRFRTSGGEKATSRDLGPVTTWDIGQISEFLTKDSL